MGTMTDDEIISKVSKIQRKGKTISFISNICLFLFFIAIMGGFVLVAGGYFLGAVVLVAGIICLPVSIITGKKTKIVNKEVKNAVGEYVIKDVIGERIDIEDYSPSKYINSEFVKKCSILPNYDRINGSDYISGKYKGVEITYCDLHLEREHRERENGRTTTTYRTNFKGPVILVDLGKEIDGYVRIKERKTPRKEKNFLSDIFNGAAEAIGIKTEDDVIEVENVEFNNQFEIKSNNHHMAFYILTPDFMEKIVEADAMAEGYTNLLFKKKRVVITINNGVDSFELNKTIYNKAQLEKSRQRVRDDFNRVLNMIDKILEKDQLF